MYLCFIKISVNFYIVMKKTLYVIFALIMSSALMAQSGQMTCDLGFTFQIGSNPNWGQNEPIITEVVPGSPADKAGLKSNDIILEVNGNGTYLKPAYTILSWFDEVDHSMSIAIRNFEYSFKLLQLQKNCRLSNAISEIQLAPVFSFYSLEDVQDRKFTIPITTKSNDDIDFFNYRTFGFAPYDASTSAMDERINAIIARYLTQMGLKQDNADPDFMIQTFYSYESNSLYNVDVASENTNNYSWRFDTRNNQMVKIPAYDASMPVKINEIMFNLEFGVRFFDRKLTEAGTSALVFESELKEKLSSNYGLMEYLELNLPLMLMKFPNFKDKSIGKYHVKFTRFNYTGLSYDINDLKTVVNVDPNSPADIAGIMPGDVIESIQGIGFNHTAKSLTESYRRFILETMKYRNQNTKYTDANGYSNAMFWDITHYYNIYKELSGNRNYKSGFSYLFSFNQYIDWEQSHTLKVVLKRGSKRMTVDVKPSLERYTQIHVE